MSLIADLRVLYHMVLKPVRGGDHAARLESFYAGQAGDYDDFRKRLLQGREKLFQSLEVPEGGIWIDMGGGTGSNLEFLGDRIGRLKKLVVVDLSPSLLRVAEQRIRNRGWKNVETITADACTFRPADDPVDVISFSYSLTMIPDWFAAIDNARSMLKPRGRIGVVDFFVSRKFPEETDVGHNWLTRHFWPMWFGGDNVFPSADHLPYLRRRFDTVQLSQHRAKVPYLPFVRVPYYTFVGQKGDGAV
jgi:S-adenosylmethionine-diacylgycerolhomoserine-N-methlytransferase